MRKLTKTEKTQVVSSVSELTEVICDECGKSLKFDDPVNKNIVIPDWIAIELLEYAVNTELKDVCSKACLIKLLNKEYDPKLRITIS